MHFKGPAWFCKEKVQFDILPAGSLKGNQYILYFWTFNIVPHKRLLKNLRNFGFNAKLIDWFSSFSQVRNQRVVLGDWDSDWCEVTSGVPQDSFIGPPLSVLCTNDLPNCVNRETKLYEDDSILMSAYSDPFDGIGLQRSIDVTDRTKDW